MAENNSYLFSHSSGDQKSEISVSGLRLGCPQGPAPSRALRENLFLASSSFWCCQCPLARVLPLVVSASVFTSPPSLLSVWNIPLSPSYEGSCGCTWGPPELSRIIFPSQDPQLHHNYKDPFSIWDSIYRFQGWRPVIFGHIEYSW